MATRYLDPTWPARPTRVLFAALVLMTLPAAAPAQVDRFAETMERGFAAMETADYETALAAFREALTVTPGHPVALAWAGNVLSIQGDPQAAQRALDAAVQAAPDYLPARLFRARALERQGRLAAAAEDLAAAVALDPDEATVRASLARVLLRAGRLDEAGEHALELTRIAPEAFAAQFLLAGIEQQRGRHQEALAAFAAADTLRPGDAAVLYGIAEALAGLGRVDDAFGALATLVEAHPDYVHGWRLYGELLAANRFELDARIAAADFLIRALELEPGSLEVARALAEIYLELRVSERVLALVAETAGAEDDAQLQLMAGRAHAEQRSYESALAAYERSFVLAPRPQTLAYRAAAERNLDRQETAIATLRQAVEMDPDYSPAWLDLGDLLLASDDVVAATEALRTAARLLPDHSQARFLLGQALRRGGDPNAAIAELEASIELDGSNAGAHYALGLAYREIGQAERSREALARFQEMERTSGQGADTERTNRARGLLRTGLVLYRLGDPLAATQRLSQALELAPEAEPGWFYLGLSLANQQQLAEAVAALEKAVALDPSRAASHDALAALYEQMGRSTEAAAARERAAALRQQSR